MDMKDNDNEFMEKAKSFLEQFGVNTELEYIALTDGGNSCIMNPESKWAKDFGGHSINGVAIAYAKIVGKPTKWI